MFENWFFSILNGGIKNKHAMYIHVTQLDARFSTQAPKPSITNGVTVCNNIKSIISSYLQIVGTNQISTISSCHGGY